MSNAPKPNAGRAARHQAQQDEARELDIVGRRLALLLQAKAAIESDEARNTRYEEAIEALLFTSTITEVGNE